MKPSSLTPFFFLVGALLFGFLIGRVSLSSPETTPTPISPEISLVQFHSLSEDQVQFSISGPVRVLWGDHHMREGEGDHTFSVAQLPDDNDLLFREFPFTGNTKTMKFYASSTYYARGVEIQHRRFFATKQTALSEGFIPTRSVR